MRTATDCQILELHLLSASRADHLDIELVAAPVGELDGLHAAPAPTISPLLQRQQCGDQISTRLGEQILLARWAFAVLATPHDARLAQLGEPARQDAARCTQPGGQVDEAVVSIEQLPRNLALRNEPGSAGSDSRR